MKTMKVIPQLLMGGALLLGSACSSTNTGMSSGSTSGSSTGTSTSMDASSGASTSGSTSGTGMGTSAAGTTSGTSTSTDVNTGVGVGSGTTANSSGMAGTVSADPAADMNAFTASFATMQDPTFLMTAASSNMLEIKMGQMALQKSTNADVKKFAQMMVDHHTKATQDLKGVASPLGVTLPQTLMPVHQAMADKLMDKSGKAFDEAYMDAMETAHKMDVALFEVKSSGAQTPAVKSFATKTLPMLRSHSKMADEIEKKVD